MENPERGEPSAGGSWEPGEGAEWEPGTGTSSTGSGTGADWEPDQDKEPGRERDAGADGVWEPGTGTGTGTGWEPDLSKELGWEPGREPGRASGSGRNQGRAARGKGSPDGQELSPAENQAIETVLHGARALLLADLSAVGIAAAGIVSMLEDAVSERRWWLRQWPEGGPHIPGLLAQDVQDALLETRGRWPLCPLCAEPHALAVEPELGPDPHWVCEARGETVAAVGSLRPFPPIESPESPDFPGG